MAKTSILNIRIDPETKAGAELLFLHQSLLVGGLPFELKQPRYNADTEAAMQEARDIITGKVQAKVYHSVAEMNADDDADPDEE